MKLRTLFLAAIMLCQTAYGLTWNSDGSSSNVQFLHDNFAIDGDTITLPLGTFSWTTQVNLTKAITISGVTTTSGDHTTFDATPMTAIDSTKLVDNLVRISGGQGFFHWTIPGNKIVRITGITFTGEGGSTVPMYNGMLRFSTASGQIGYARVDHCHFTRIWHQNTLGIYNTVYGVNDHCLRDFIPAYMEQDIIGNGTGWGDLEFSQPMPWGGPNMWFFEDNYVDNSTGFGLPNGGVDEHGGGKYVYRYSYLVNVELLNHGTELSRLRSGRGYELYNNHYVMTQTQTLDGIRGGAMIVHDNTYTGVKPNGYALNTFRTFYSGLNEPWNGASGANVWDLNVTEANGTHIDGHPPYLFESGTVTSGSENCGSAFMYLTDNTKTWAVNHWAGYTALRPSDNMIGYINSNTSNTLEMMYYYYSGACVARWRAGDTYQIHQYLAAIDQPCRGAGDLITGDTVPINTVSGVQSWPRPVIEPCYSWNNIHTPGNEHINYLPHWTNVRTLLSGRDYFNDTPLPGYTPYTYPHPLVNGSPVPTPTATATATPTATATATATATFTPTPTATATATFTPTPTATATATSTATATATESPTATPTATATFTPTATATSTATATFTPTPTATATATATPTNTPTPTPTPCLAPSPPSGLTCSRVSRTKINIEWTDNSSNETGFLVERGTDGITFSQIGSVAVDVTIYHDIKLNENALYYYRVRATNACGNSAYCVKTSCTTLGSSPTPTPTATATPTFAPSPTPLPTPAAPSDLTVTATACQQWTLNWTDNSINETGFKIEASSDNVTFSQIDETVADVTSYVSNLGVGGLEYYRVRAFIRIGVMDFDSDYSNTASDTASACSTPSPTPTPTATPTPGALPNPPSNEAIPAPHVVSWSPNASEEHVTQYTLYRRGTGQDYSAMTTTTETSVNVVPYLTGKRTTFRTTATNALGEGPPSKSVTDQRH